ncbi:hypothetical protein CALCODRAFT_555671 [Calocera cornea HHB12733]|uniref:Uncharacterized protein n=1 Tax=Calocera cornea HHB12733 TaxID=1353952 RepID=A0A165FJD7_9BASI|nr:hypothetical protein CALCODRAFT_555671 [Calocera cornea HHB12733]
MPPETQTTQRDWSHSIPPELWLHLLHLLHRSRTPFFPLLRTCRTLYNLGISLQYLGVEFVYNAQGGLMQLREGRVLPAGEYALRTSERARALRSITVRRFKPDLAASSPNFAAALGGLRSLALSDTWLTPGVLTLLTGMDGLASLHLQCCHIAGPLLLSDVPDLALMPSRARLETLELFELQLDAPSSSEADAQLWATASLSCLLQTLAGPCLRKFDISPPRLLSSTGHWLPFPHLSQALQAIPDSLTHLRLRLPQSPVEPLYPLAPPTPGIPPQQQLMMRSLRRPVDPALLCVFSALLCQLTELRVLLLPFAPYGTDFHLSPGALGRIEHLSAPEGGVWDFYPFVRETLRSVRIPAKEPLARSDADRLRSRRRLVKSARRLLRDMPGVEVLRFCLPPGYGQLQTEAGEEPFVSPPSPYPTTVSKALIGLVLVRRCSGDPSSRLGAPSRGLVGARALWAA